MVNPFYVVDFFRNYLNKGEQSPVCGRSIYLEKIIILQQVAGGYVISIIVLLMIWDRAARIDP